MSMIVSSRKWAQGRTSCRSSKFSASIFLQFTYWERKNKTIRSTFEIWPCITQTEFNCSSSSQSTLPIHPPYLPAGLISHKENAIRALIYTRSQNLASETENKTGARFSQGYFRKTATKKLYQIISSASFQK